MEYYINMLEPVVFYKRDIQNSLDILDIIFNKKIDTDRNELIEKMKSMMTGIKNVDKMKQIRNFPNE